MAGKEVDMTYHPSISVQPITSQFLRDRFQTMNQLLDKGKSDSDQTIKDVSDKLDDLTANLNRETSELNKKQIKLTDTPNEEIENTAKAVLAKSKTNLDVISILDDLAANDLPNFVFLDIIGRMLIQNEAWPLRHHILSVQQKGNVFYIQDHITFSNVDISVNDAEKKHVGTTFVDQEIFFFSKAKDGYLVQTLLPPVPDRTDNVTWSKSWLTGLQIPID